MNAQNRWKWCVGQSLLLGLMVVCWGSNRPTEKFESAASAVTYLIKVAEIDTDTSFKKQLIDDQRDHLIAPRLLRAILRGEKIELGTLAQGISHENGAISLYWTSNFCVIYGYEADTQKRLLARLDKWGFEPFPSSDRRYKFAYRRYLNGAEETILFSEPGNNPGSRPISASFQFLWTVRSTATTPMPTFAEMKGVMPYFHDTRVGDTVYRMFQDATLVRIQRDSSLLAVDIRRFPEPVESVDELHRQLLDRVKQAGFKQTPRPKNDTVDKLLPGDSPHSRPIIRVRTDEEDSCVHLRIQPE